MIIKIRDTKAHTEYYASSRSSCKGVDKHLWDMVEITGQTVTMGSNVGNIILRSPAPPLPPSTNQDTDHGQQPPRPLSHGRVA